MRSVALRLINYETLKNDASETGTAATFPMTERLRPHLATLMGNGGFRALLARALVLAGAEVSWLRKVQVNPDGTLEGLATLHAQFKPGEFRDGQVVLLAQLLRLLVAFIGPVMTLRLMGEIWPQLAADNVDFGNGDKK